MGIVSIVTSVICKSLRNANKNKVCTCPRCKHAIKRYPEHIEERSIDSPLLIRCPSCGNIVHDPLAAEIALLPPEKAFMAAANGYAGTWKAELQKNKYALSRLRKSLERLNADEEYLRQILSLQGMSPDCYYAVFNSGRLRFNARSGNEAPKTLTEEEYLQRFYR